MSELSELYQQVILDHNKKPRNFRKLESANHTAEGYNPLCGDQLTVYLKMNGDKIEDISFVGQGCAISKASASLMTAELKGKTEAVRIFTVVGDEGIAASPEFQALRMAHLAALAAYRDQRWDEAEAKLSEAQTITSTGPGLMKQITHFYDIYAERIAEYRENPPEANWDAVYVATSK